MLQSDKNATDEYIMYYPYMAIMMIWVTVTVILMSQHESMGHKKSEVKLPETRNNKLPESIEESLELGQSVRRNKFGLILNEIEFSNKSMKSLDT